MKGQNPSYEFLLSNGELAGQEIEVNVVVETLEMHNEVDVFHEFKKYVFLFPRIIKPCSLKYYRFPLYVDVVRFLKTFASIFIRRSGNEEELPSSFFYNVSTVYCVWESVHHCLFTGLHGNFTALCPSFSWEHLYLN